jgi:pyrroloquinoline quinone (PQQ) biosynthesis protein C
MAHLWTLLANFQTSVSKNFARHLARITARVEDDRVRSILAHQLDDELGNGDPQRAHVRLFQTMMDQLAAFRPATIDDAMWQPGRNFDANLRACYEAEDAWEAVGAVMVGEVFGKQIDLFLGAQLRRQSAIDAESLEWLVLHERLEVEHAADSAELAGLVTSDDFAAVWRGAQRAGAAGRAFLDDLYTACYGRHA